MIDIAELFNFEQFLYGYIIFICFFIFIIGLAGSDLSTILVDLNESNLAEINASIPTPPTEPSVGSGSFDWIGNLFAQPIYFIENIRFFFVLMTLDTGIFWLGLLVFTPAFLFMLWGIMKLLRG